MRKAKHIKATDKARSEATNGPAEGTRSRLEIFRIDAELLEVDTTECPLGHIEPLDVNLDTFELHFVIGAECSQGKG